MELAKEQVRSQKRELRFVNKHHFDEKICKERVCAYKLKKYCKAHVKVNDSCIGNSHPGKA